MRRFIFFTLAGLVAGALFGYFIFAKDLAGDYISPNDLLPMGKDFLGELKDTVQRTESIRWNVILTTLFGTSFGINLFFISDSLFRGRR